MHAIHDGRYSGIDRLAGRVARTLESPRIATCDAPHRVCCQNRTMHPAQVETFKPYLKPHVLHLRKALLGQDPTISAEASLRIWSGKARFL
jgi:hypothetical protein